VGSNAIHHFALSHPLRGAVVEKLCEYMVFRSYYENDGLKEEVPVKDFMERLPPEVALELLVTGPVYLSIDLSLIAYQVIGRRLS